jgi:hypothetical protein
VEPNVLGPDAKHEPAGAIAKEMLFMILVTPRTDRRGRSRVAAIGVAALLAGAAGCAASLDDPARFTGGIACTSGIDVETELLQTTCGSAACHDGDNPQAGMDLASPGVAARLTGVAAMCPEQTLVVAGDPEASYLYQKTGSTPACGARMPSQADPLSAEQRACLAAWITGLGGGGDDAGAGGDDGGAPVDGGGGEEPDAAADPAVDGGGE